MHQLVKNKTTVQICRLMKLIWQTEKLHCFWQSTIFIIFIISIKINTGLVWLMDIRMDIGEG